MLLHVCPQPPLPVEHSLTSAQSEQNLIKALFLAVKDVQYTHQVLTKTDVVISSAESVSMVTGACVVAGSVHTCLVATCCAFSTFVDVCIEIDKDRDRDKEDQMRRHSCRSDTCPVLTSTVPSIWVQPVPSITTAGVTPNRVVAVVGTNMVILSTFVNVYRKMPNADQLMNLSFCNL